MLAHKEATQDIETKCAHSSIAEDLVRVMSSLLGVHHIMVREEDQQKLLDAVCTQLLSNRGYHDAWIALREESGRPKLTAHSGVMKEALEKLSAGEFGNCFLNAISNQLSQIPVAVVNRRLENVCRDCPLVALSHKRGALITNIRCQDRLFGWLFVSASMPVVLNEHHQNLVAQLGEDIGFALTKISLDKERDMYEQKIKESNEFLSCLLRNSPNAIFVANPDGTINCVNEQFERLTGLSSSEITGKTPPYPWSVTPVSDTPLGLAYRQDSKPAVDISELFIRNATGDILCVHQTSAPVRSGSQVKYYINSWRDITQIRHLEENLKFYVKEMTKSQEEERKRISRELHDSVLQALLTMKLNAHRLTMFDGLAEDFRHQLDQFVDSLSNVISEIRSLSHDLRPALLEKIGLIRSIDLLIQDIRSQRGVNCAFTISGRKAALKPEIEATLFRITQEALNNIAKHARAEKAIIRLQFQKFRIVLTIRDEGVGFQAPNLIGDFIREGKIGLIGMQERALMNNGSLTVSSSPGNGTTLKVVLPTAAGSDIAG